MKSILDRNFQYRDHLNTNVAETIRRAQAEVKQVRVVKLPPLGKSNEIETRKGEAK